MADLQLQVPQQVEQAPRSTCSHHGATASHGVRNMRSTSLNGAISPRPVPPRPTIADRSARSDGADRCVGDEIVGEADDLVGRKAVEAAAARPRSGLRAEAAARSRRGPAQAPRARTVAAWRLRFAAGQRVGRSTARRSMIARRSAIGAKRRRSFLPARPPAASARRAPRAPRAASASRDRSRPARRRADRLPASGSAARRTAADRRARRRSRRSRRARPRAWRAPTWRARAPRAAGRRAWRRRCRSCGRPAPSRDLVQQHEIALPLARADVVQRQRVEPVGEPRQLVIMGREQAAAADLVVHRLDHRPGDREPVIGRGAAADLVEDDEARSASPARGSRRSRPSRP